MSPLFTPIRLVLLLGLSAAVLVGFALIPAAAQLPVHWNMVGEPDRFLPRDFALLIPPALLAVVWLVLVGIQRLLAPERREAAAAIMSATLTALTLLFTVMTMATVAIGLGYDVGIIRLVAGAMAVLLIVLGNALPKSRPNAVAGIRIPTTLADPANWHATHRLTGMLAIVGGVILLAAAFLVPQSLLLWWLLACVLLPIAIGVIFSLVRARSAS